MEESSGHPTRAARRIRRAPPRRRPRAALADGTRASLRPALSSGDSQEADERQGRRARGALLRQERERVAEKREGEQPSPALRPPPPANCQVQVEKHEDGRLRLSPPDEARDRLDMDRMHREEERGGERRRVAEVESHEQPPQEERRRRVQQEGSRQRNGSALPPWIHHSAANDARSIGR